MKKLLQIIPAAVLATLAFYGCSKDDDDDGNNGLTPYPSTISGYYEADGGRFGGDTLVVEFKNNQGVVTYMDPNNLLATNASAFKVGDPFFRNISKIDDNKWEAEVVEAEYPSNILDKRVVSIKYVKTVLSYSDRNDGKISSSEWPDNYSSFDKTPNSYGSAPNGGSGGGGTGGGGTGGGGGIEGTWYNTACGDKRGVVWYFASPSSGNSFFSNKDCNGICDPFKLKFTYKITGNSCQVTYLDQAQQDEIECTGYAPKRPTVPTKTEPFTFKVNGDELEVTSANGTTTFKKNP